MGEWRRGPCQSKFYTACLRLRARQSSTVFAHESPTRSAGFGAENGVLCVKFCKRRSFGLGLCGLAELGFLVFLEIAHVEVAVGLEPVFVGLDG